MWAGKALYKSNPVPFIVYGKGQTFCQVICSDEQGNLVANRNVLLNSVECLFKFSYCIGTCVCRFGVNWYGAILMNPHIAIAI